LKGNGEHTKIQQKRKFPIKKVLKGSGVSRLLTIEKKFPMKRVLKEFDSG
jgi:hypothetical protein